MVQVRALRAPKKQHKKQRRRSIPPTYRLGVKDMQQQPQPQDPPPHPVPRRVVPWPRPPAHRRLAGRSPTPQLITSGARPVQVPEITSEFMENDVEVVEELSQPPPIQAKSTPTGPGDITSTTDSEMSSANSLPVLDLSDELVHLNNMHEEVAREAKDYIARMNIVGIFFESLEIGPMGFGTVNSHLIVYLYAYVISM